VLTALSGRDVSPDEKRQVMERVLASQTFSRSDQLRRFLQYICEKDISGKAEEINEYSIAVDALGRAPDYSPSDDSSVRTRAHALRQKLQEYYELEEPDAELRIEVPKGRYNPHFLTHAPVPLPAPLLTAAFPDPSAMVAPPPPRPLIWKPFLAGVLASALVFAFILLVRHPFRHVDPIAPILREAWGPMLNPGEKVAICIATPPAMLLHSYKEGQLPVYHAPLMPVPAEVSSWYQRLQMLDGGGNLYMHTTQDVFLFGDSLASTSAVQLVSQAGAAPQLTPESDLRAFALRGWNTVLIGSPNYSPLAARFLMNAPFSVRYDPGKREEVVSDGAKRIYYPSRDAHGMLTKAYGLVTVLPSQPDGEGGARTLIFSGITSAGPQAALEFFRSPEGLSVLKAKLKREGFTKFPLAYQVVVRCGLDHNLALNWEYEAHQVMKESPLLR
jgi:hypothetical protein